VDEGGKEKSCWAAGGSDHRPSSINKKVSKKIIKKWLEMAESLVYAVGRKLLCFIIRNSFMAEL
jgi:hypothetical protein